MRLQALGRCHCVKLERLNFSDPLFHWLLDGTESVFRICSGLQNGALRIRNFPCPDLPESRFRGAAALSDCGRAAIVFLRQNLSNCPLAVGSWPLFRCSRSDPAARAVRALLSELCSSWVCVKNRSAQAQRKLLQLLLAHHHNKALCHLTFPRGRLSAS